MSSKDIRAQFAEYGFVRLDATFADAAPGLAEAVLAELARSPKLTALRRTGFFDALATTEVVSAITSLLGHAEWPRPFSWGDPLVTAPGSGTWTVPTGGWHLDFPARGALALKWLGYLAPVRAGGGGTVVLSGSHRLVARYLERADPADPGRSPAVRDAIFGGHPWLRGVREPGAPAERIERLMDRGAVIDGVEVRVVELTGRPGDVVFLHPHLFHAPAPNCLAEPRLMVTGGLLG